MHYPDNRVALVARKKGVAEDEKTIHLRRLRKQNLWEILYQGINGDRIAFMDMFYRAGFDIFRLAINHHRESVLKM
jgi:hypothetical protein